VSGSDSVLHSPERFPIPWTQDYVDRHRAFVGDVLDSTDIVDLFARRLHLPRGYGVGLDERCVEYPWLRAQQPSRRTLDAGSTLNHDHILDRLQPLLAELHITTLVPESDAFTERGISYIYADLRRLPLRDRYYDTIISVSTLEHVGMDNSLYGAERGRAHDSSSELHAAVTELKRVLAPGGTMLVTLPYGVREDHGWFRQFDRADTDELIDMFQPRQVSLSVYRYDRDGWQISDLDAAASARYHDYMAEQCVAEDLAAAARAVVCLKMTF
jgi:SAM-dependent methyltransferase